jgi:hypothetical protein
MRRVVVASSSSSSSTFGARVRPSLDRSTGEGQKRGPAPVRGERARVVDATTDGTSTG